MAVAGKHELNVRMQGAIKFALEQVAQVRPLDPVTFVAEKLLEYDRTMDEEEKKLSGDYERDTPAVPTFYMLGNAFTEEQIVPAIRNAAVRGELLDSISSTLGEDPSGFILVALRGLRGHALQAPVVAELSGLLRAGNLSVLKTLGMVAASQSELFDTDVLEEAFMKATMSGDAEVRRMMACALAAAVTSGRIPYDTEIHRSHAADMSLEGAFLCCCCVHDHEWFIQNKLELLGDKPTTLIPLLAATCEGLTTREIRCLSTELLLKPDDYTDRTRAAIEESLIDAADAAINKGDLMRWSAE